jgi:ribosomal protein S18 acetylase RimI-like enzyme
VSVVSIRPFSLADLDSAAILCDRARQRDVHVEPFAYRLGLVATGPRARLDLWRIAEDESGAVQGIAFAAERESRGRPGGSAVLDVYAAVVPELRRQGLGRALCEAMLQEPAVLRARVREESAAGRAFLTSLGFAEQSAQLSLSWSARPLAELDLRAVRIRPARAEDATAIEVLSRAAWSGEPDAFAPRSDEVAQLFAESDRLVLLAESGRLRNVSPVSIGYLTAVRLGPTLGIEEVAVLPEFRRAGVGRALVTFALRGVSHAVLSVAESNRAGRALYASLAFFTSARRIVCERAA